MRFRSIFLVLFGGNIVVTAANLLRDVALASAFGATRESDILFLAISIPLFLLSVAANAFRSVTVPALGKAFASGVLTAKSVARRFLLLANTSTIVVSMLLGIVALVLYWTPIPSVTPEARQLFSAFLAAILPMYLCAAVLELWQGPLQAYGRFMAPNLLRLGLPCGMAIGALTLPQLSIFGVALGGGIGTLVAIACGLLLLASLGIFPGTREPALPDPVGQVALANYTALVVATCITYANPIVDQWMASFTGAGGISMLGYASRITTGIVALGAASLSQALLVHFSRLVGESDYDGIRDTYRDLLRVAPWLGCFATLAVWLTSGFAVALLYERGNFSNEISGRVSTLVDLYALQFPIYWTGVAAFTLIWATSMNRVFLRIGIVLFAVNAVSDYILIQILGLNGIPLTTSIVYALSVVLLNVALRNAGIIRLGIRDILLLMTPFAVLGTSWLAIRHFGLRLAPDAEPSIIATSVLMLAAFGAIGANAAYRVLFKRPERP